MNKATVHVIYCDDIRNEAFGKLSLMGVYHADLIIPAFPATLPKLCAYIVAKFPWGKQPKKLLELKLLKDEEVVAQFAMDESSLGVEALPPPAVTTPKDEQLLAIQIGFTLSPLHLGATTQLRVHCEADGKIIKGNSLRIRLPNADEQQMFAGGMVLG